MGLAEFIQTNKEAILAEWETFAATQIPAAAGMTSLALRDHAPHMLDAVAKDLGTPQTREEQSEKSKGQAPEKPWATETAAQTHAVLRAQSGFTVIQLVAEYRSLRASVLRLWMDATRTDGGQDVMRFNEAIDQAIAESVGHFQSEEDRARNLLLGMIGHDMRTPLQSIMIMASFLADLNAGEEVSRAAELLMRGGASIQSLLDDLVDFNRVKLGLGIRVEPSDIDLAADLEDEMALLRAAHQNSSLELVTTGDNRGCWDDARMKQVLRNLVSNSINYGFPDTPVRVALRGEETEVCLDVTNNGPFIEPSDRSRLFDPLSRGSTENDSHDASGSLGLGLFIVREIAHAHGGETEVLSDGREITFAVRLPRNREASP